MDGWMYVCMYVLICPVDVLVANNMVAELVELRRQLPPVARCVECDAR